MMQKLELTTWERVQLMGLIAQQQGNLDQLRRYIRLLNVLDLTEDEKGEVGWEQGDDGRAAWTDAQRTWEVELEDADFELLKRTAVGFSGWTVSPLVVGMLEKLDGGGK